MINDLMTSFPSYSRFKTRVVNIGDLPMGGDHPIRVQSMTNTDTLDTKGTVEQSIRMILAGCEYVRIAVPGIRETENLRNIKKELVNKGYKTPLIADVHFNPKLAEIAATIVEKVRINPGNYIEHSSRVTRHASRDMNNEEALEQIATRLKPLLKICKEHGTAIRIGTNHGSLSDRIISRFGNTAEGMVESALEFAHICGAFGFHDLVLSLKASNTRVMIQANRRLVERMRTEGLDYPLHLGVTEAGAGEDGRLKSAVGIGSLLADGIGDTIRVSITEDPEFEIPVAYGILQATGVRITKTEYISCPSCARTLFNIQETLEKIKQVTGHLKGLKIAVMGCIVNGPGEMADAHYGYVGAGKGKVMLYKGEELVKRNIDESNAVEELIELIRDSGDWKDA
ncbi:MAG: (E)-4-hydroxy-3-methylbut-2-enyl-diphosphate synthase [Bacteroidetes bacterium]|nr:(E)-4-hydroxy-3-methylbut-2-enyl-diphosphate synthase [Bacteroidota bacterium]